MTIICFEISTQPITEENWATVDYIKEHLTPNNHLWVDGVNKIEDVERNEVIASFISSLPEGFTFDNGSFKRTGDPHYINYLVEEIKQELDDKDIINIAATGSPLLWFRERICGWGQDFVLIDGEVMTMREFFLYSSGCSMRNKQFYLGAVFECHY